MYKDMTLRKWKTELPTQFQTGSRMTSAKGLSNFMPEGECPPPTPIFTLRKPRPEGRGLNPFDNKWQNASILLSSLGPAVYAAGFRML
jgi:hypothetical protein